MRPTESRDSHELASSSASENIIWQLRVWLDMAIPLHLGIGHPNLVWIGITAILAFIAGMGVNLYRSTNEQQGSDASIPDEDTQ